MIRLIPFLLLAVVFYFSANLSSAQSFRLGLRGGITATQVDGDQLQGFDKGGLLGGLTLSRQVSERTSVGMEMFFIQKGSRKPLNKDDNSYYLMRLTYLEVPFLVRWDAGKKFIFETGPAFGVLVHSMEKDQIGVINYAPAFEKREYSFNAGMGYRLSDELVFDARYSFSLLPVRRFESALNYLYWDRGQFNSVLQLSLNYVF
jgi:hypothetical protein